MAGAKIVVLYPRPSDVDVFEKAYTQDHVPLVPKFKGITKFIQSKVIGAPGGGTPAFHRIAELHFPSMDTLNEAAASAGAQEAVAHAVSISTGGAPVFLVCEEETRTF
ncbi:MAG: EthD family reductase [Gemmatimonadetes bacterium]|nr:EthD family reductase [Gemmatimonadota bacterium]